MNFSSARAADEGGEGAGGSGSPNSAPEDVPGSYIGPVSQLVETVTFVFTDIEGSTRLLRRVHDAYVRLLSEHHRLLDDAVEREGGRRLSTEGDGAFFVFDTPGAAVRASVAIQHAHHAHTWPEDQPVRVRVGIHTGDAVLTPEGNYVGLTVHLAARVMSLGHGGQTLVTDATRSLVDEVPDGVHFHDLGLHSIPDFPDPVRIHQVDAGRKVVFPPLQTAIEARLPATIGRLFGREAEIGQLVGVLADHRMVTVLGPGGTGKTRLAIETARRLRTHGTAVHFVDLTAVASPGLMPSYVASVLDVAQDPNVSPIPQIAAALGRRAGVLVLDNCEHLMPHAGRVVADLLAADDRVRVLATSRTPLGVAGERLFDLDPLAVDGGETAPAIQLFADRAADVAPEFTLTDDRVDLVRAIVGRLDGLPLAIELAASMIRVLPLEELATVLADRLDLLEASDGRPDRHRSLAAALRWNVESLDPATRDAFYALGVMTGPFSVDDLGAVVGAGMRDAIRIATALTDRSLLKRVTVEGRANLRMLDTMRWFALDALGEGVTAVRDRHLEVFREVAVHARTALRGPEAALTIGRLWPRRSNLLAAFDHALDTGRLDAATELVEGLVDAWGIRATAREARLTTTRLLEAVTDAPAELQLRAVFARLEAWQNQGVGVSPEQDLALRANELATQVGDAAARARSRLWLITAGIIPTGDPDELVAELEATGDHRSISYGLDVIGWMLWWAARQEEAVAVFRRAYRQAVDAKDAIGTLDAAAGIIATCHHEDDANLGVELLDEVAPIVEQIGCRWWEGYRLQWLSSHSRRLGHLEESMEWLARAYDAACERGTLNQIAFISAHQAAVAWDADEVEVSYRKTMEFADANRASNENPYNPFILEMAAGAALAWGRLEDAARLCGAAAGWRRPGGLFELGMPMPVWDEARHHDIVDRIKKTLGAERMDELMGEGETLTPDAALTLAQTLAP